MNISLFQSVTWKFLPGMQKMYFLVLFCLNQNLKQYFLQYHTRCIQLGDNCIQNVHLVRYIDGYIVGNFVLRLCVSRAIKRNFRPYNGWDTSPNEHFEYDYSILMHFLTFIRQRHSILHQTQHKTTMSTNHKRCHLWNRCSDDILQNIQTQTLDIIQSDVALDSQVH